MAKTNETIRSPNLHPRRRGLSRSRSRQSSGKKEGEEYLQVHHIVPYRIFEDNSEENLITLCSECHAKQEYTFVKVNGLKLIPKKEIVYNFSVDEDESYIAEDIIVHNCRSTVIFLSKEETEEQKNIKDKQISKELDIKMKEKEFEIKKRKESLLKKLEDNIDGGNKNLSRPGKGR